MTRLAPCGIGLLASIALGFGEAPLEPLGLIFQEASLTVSPSTVQQPPNVAHGRTLYVAHCGRCHGMEGGGGEGPRLKVRQLQRAADLESLQGLIRAGVAGTPMRGLRIVNDDDVRDIAGYVWSLGRANVPVARLPGDPNAGAALYASMDCSSCHIVDGKGGTLGPALTNIGHLRGIDHLREALVDPGATLPENLVASAVGSIYLLVSVETLDGRRITGTRVNEDTFTIQIRDEEDIYHSIRKDEIVLLKKRFGESLMPAYGETVNEEGINALVSYLATLRDGS